jgi:uncharacterized protein (TIGR04255 family)
MIQKDNLKRHYDQPPITEAVIAVNFKTPLDEKLLLKLKNKYLLKYPQAQSISNVNVAVAMNKDDVQNPVANVNHQKGWRLSTKDMTQIVVIFPNSLTISQLAPYDGWDSFLNRFKRDWKICLSISKKEISRLGVRYINRLDIPIRDNIVEHEKYLNIYPMLPKQLTPLNAFAVQSAISLPTIGCELLLNSGLADSPILNCAGFMLDLDIFKMNDLPQSEKALYDLLDTIRMEKNKIFESCIKPKSRRLFKK